MLYDLLSDVRSSEVLIATIILYLASALLNRLTDRGVMNWPVFGILPSLLANFGDVYGWATNCIVRAGGTFPYRGLLFCGLFGVITGDPANLEYVLKTNFQNYPKGRYYRERFVDFLGDGVFNADEEKWKEQRRAATMEMHSSRFLEYSATTISQLVHDKLLKVVHKLAQSGRQIDLQDLLLRFTFDNISSAAFGVDTACLANINDKNSFAKAFENATECTLYRFVTPPFVWKLMRKFNIGHEKSLKIAVKTVHDFADKTVNDRKDELQHSGGLSHKSDLLSRLVETSEAGNFRFSNKFMKDFCISFILAGRDTSSVALTWFFWLVSRHPWVEKTILAELRSVVEDLNKTTTHHADDFDPNNVIFSVGDLKKMDYLQAAISEALRLYPSVPIDFKEALEDDVLPSGSIIKKRGKVMYSIYSMGRMESIWGKDCLEYKPERWLKEGEFVTVSQFKYAVFNAGPRLCIGKKFAYTQMKMVAAAVMIRYSIDIVEGQEVIPKLNTTLYMKNGLQVKFIPRN